MRHLLIIIALLTTVHANGQDEVIDSLRTGFWSFYYKEDSHLYTQKGVYKIIPAAKYDTIGEWKDERLWIKYRGKKAIVSFYAKVNNKYSVKDGIWKHYDGKGTLRKISYWMEGLNQWSIHYNEKGDLTALDYDDYDNNSYLQYTYMNGCVFKKEEFSPNLKTYYPDYPLKISDAELEFTVDFFNKPTASQTITLGAKQDVTIKSISKSGYIKLTINNKPVTLPFTIKANTSVPLKITVAPSTENYQYHDTLTLVTAENNTAYNIYSGINAYHLNLKTVRELRSLETLRSVNLSKSKDKYLILPSDGTIEYAAITSFNGKQTDYSIKEASKIDLSVLPVGSYRLHVYGSEEVHDYEHLQLFLNITK